MKSNPYDNFTQAIDSMVLSEKPMQDRVLDAYTKHISRVEAENIPQKVQSPDSRTGILANRKRVKSPRLFSLSQKKSKKTSKPPINKDL
jgi:hypothetical protein